MTFSKIDIELTKPKEQINLYGYKKYFKTFVKLYNNKKLPNVILLSGLKGLGKATFAYHFINYLLSNDEDHSYSIDDFKIKTNNKSYNLILNNLHPNFFLLDTTTESENIKIEYVRNLIKFTNKSTYSKDIKLVLIDNAECLNENSANAMLKTLEEPAPNTFFFIIHNSSAKILDTIKSRSIKFNIFFSLIDKKKIFENILNDFDFDFKFDSSLYFETPGNFLKYLILFKDLNDNNFSSKLDCISFLIDKYKTSNDQELLNVLSSLIEQYYNAKSLEDSKNLNNHFFYRNKILNNIHNVKKFNLDKKNLFISIKEFIANETR